MTYFMDKITPSNEQQNVIDKVLQGNNVVVDAVAGSGKSTVVLMTASKMPDCEFLQVTYNSMLRKEVRDKTHEWRLSNLTVHTYHSLAVKYYNRQAHTDIEIQNILRTDTPPMISIPFSPILVLDEVQDMTLLYYRFMRKFIKDMCNEKTKKIQLMILGDVMQGLYNFKGADVRFLTKSAEIWGKCNNLSNPVDFIPCQLRISYRITTPMAEYVNKVMLGEERLLACKEGNPVFYIRGTRTETEIIIKVHIRELLKQGNRPDDIFILAASVKGVHSNIRLLENFLVNQGLPCYVPSDEQDQLDERVIQGKIVFSTFHSVKGRQRKHVFVMGFDNTYLEWFGRDLNSKQCPNTLYVACTRGQERLYLFETNDQPYNRPLDFLKMNHVEMKKQDFIDFRGNHQLQFYEKNNNNQDKEKKHRICATGIIKFLSEDVIYRCLPIIERVFVPCKTGIDIEQQIISIPNVVETKSDEGGFYEDVSNLNGVAIPFIFYSHILGETQRGGIYKMTKRLLDNTRPNDYLYLKNVFREKMPRECQTITDFLLSANILTATQEKLYSRLKQIQQYDWIQEDKMTDCLNRMKQVILEQEVLLKTEEYIVDYGGSTEAETSELNKVLKKHFPEKTFEISACVDLITDRSVWELKFVNHINVEHFLQVVVYAWIWRTIGREPKVFRLFNIKSGEYWTLEASNEELTDMMIWMLEGKYGEQPVKSDEEFLQQVL